MWEEIMKYFKRNPSQQRVARVLLAHGLSVRDGKIYCGRIELSISKVARAINVDRRVIMNTIKTIESEEKLKKVFEMLAPTCHFKELATQLGWGVLVITPVDPSMPGILADVARIIAKEKISIRQAIVEDYCVRCHMPLTREAIEKERKKKLEQEKRLLEMLTPDIIKQMLEKMVEEKLQKLMKDKLD